ncbi:precorrin-3B synthase [Planotetraspora thailandica]|uniref:Precorrin-3B synthase n=1 Tax=Planotetraspora thailandica TaxID=487172 RepID=A0A8J3Y081_9ACTN|nr:precorrin-3B synthase [Planotetraspora thailandica]GII58419.1 precorrin-3B synthase [Planotetraspora thailandica]
MAIADFSGRAHPDACPGALQVHTAADGGLARIRVPGGALTPSQLHELAACAAELGAGVVELTSRANVQVRGLGSPETFATRMAAAGLLPSDTHERVRNIVASPLSGRVHTSLIDVRPLVEALDSALCARPRLAGLSGRFLFALDDGTGDVAGLGADVTLLARSRTAWAVLLAGVEAGIVQALDDAVGVMLAAAEAFLDELAVPEEVAGPGSAWRIAELENGPARVAARLRPGDPAVADGTTRNAGGTPRPGTHDQTDGRVALEVVVPLGRLSAAQAHLLAEAARETQGETRLTPWRTVIVPDLAPASAARWARAVTEAGLVADPSSPWAGVSACTGRPGCAKSLADVQADATRAVTQASTQAAHLLPVHWAGCERRCGRPRGTVVEVVATGHGYRIELDGDRRTGSDVDETAAAVAAFRTSTPEARGEK